MPDRRRAIIVWMENMQGNELLSYSQMKHFLDEALERMQILLRSAFHSMQTAHQEAAKIGVC